MFITIIQIQNMDFSFANFKHDILNYYYNNSSAFLQQLITLLNSFLSQER